MKQATLQQIERKDRTKQESDVGAGSSSLVGRGELVVGVSVDSLDNGELKSGTSHGESLGSLDILRVQGNSADNLDGIGLSSVVTSHFLVFMD